MQIDGAEGTVSFKQASLENKNSKQQDQQNEIVAATNTDEVGSESSTNSENNENSVNMSGIKPPKCFVTNTDIDLSQEWTEWLELYENYFIAAKVNKEEAQIQTANFISAAGRDVLKVLNNLNLTTDEKKSLTTVKEKLTAHFAPAKNKTYERCQFHRMKQQPNEMFEDFWQKLKTQVKRCGYESKSENEFVMDQIVLGVCSDNTRQKLWTEDELTLEKSIKICRAAERAEKQMNELQSETASLAVHAVNTSKSYDCKRCGRNHAPRTCPAFNKICKACGRKGHFQVCCFVSAKSSEKKNTSKHNKFSKKVNAMEAENEYSDDDSDEEYEINNVELNKEQYRVNFFNKEDEKWTAAFMANGEIINTKLDSGAECNVLPLKEVKRIKAKIVESPTKRLITYNNQKIDVIGEVRVPCRNKKHTQVVVFKVVKENLQPILGRRMCEKMGFIKRVRKLDIDVIEAPTSTKQQKAVEPKPSEIGCYKDYEYDIDLVDEPSFKIIPPRRIPHAIRDQVKGELERMVKMKIIEPVSEPTPAVSAMLAVNKGKLRVCMDPTDLNKNIKRRHFPMKTVEEISAKLSGSKFFTKLDCEKGFWQIKVSERTSKYLTFATPWGRYKYLRMPFGISSAPEVFSEIMSRLLEGIKNCEVAMDDIFIYSDTAKDLEKTTKIVMDRLTTAGFTLNKSKCEFCKRKVKFLGHLFSEKGVEADTEKIKAIHQLKTPTNVEEVQRLLGMVNYVGKFVKNLSDMTEPLRELLLKATAWHWKAEHDKAVGNIKEALTSLPVLAFYDVNKPVKLSVDASSKALGCGVFQDDRPIAYGTRALTKTQQGYPQIVKEAMAIRFACTKFHEYVYGKKLLIETDHKPLETIFKKSIAEAPMRLQQILWDVVQYAPTVKYIKGTDIPIADTLSRDCHNTEFEKEEKYHINAILAITDDAYQRLVEETKRDLELQLLKSVINCGWPDNETNLPEAVKPYATFKAELTHENGLLFKGNRVILPKNQIPKILSDLHKGHSGINSTLSRARQSTFWLGQSKDVKDMIEVCAICQRTQRANVKEPALMKRVPDYPFQIVASDVFNFAGHEYLLIADHYSGFFDFKRLRSTSSTETIKHLKQWFSTHGIPEIFESDGGTNYTSKEFKEFSNGWKFEHRMSSPRYPRSNGFAERNVQTAKNLLKKCSMDKTDPQLALLLLRNTERNNTLKSQSQRLFSRSTRTTLPTDRKLLHPKLVGNVSEELERQRTEQKQYFDKHTKKAEQLKVGDKVRLQIGHREWVGAKVTENTPFPRSVIVETNNGKKYRRNQHHLHKTKAEIKSPTYDTLEFNEHEESKANENSNTNNSNVSTETTSNQQANESPNSNATGSNQTVDNPSTIKTTRSGRIVKPVDRFDPSPIAKSK